MGSDYHRRVDRDGAARAAEAGVAERALRGRLRPRSSAARATTSSPCSTACTTWATRVGAARHVRDVIADDGTWMIVEPMAGDYVEDNLNPVGRAYYGFSHAAVHAVVAVAGRGARARHAGGAGADPRRDGRGRLHAVPSVAETPFNRVIEARP